ncbi:MAG: thioredoxin family protein [Candidatus Wallbacteria bacterium]|nr:thioredoxin family protein [Candidatus Wallbacteria bacterium]
MRLIYLIIPLILAYGCGSQKKESLQAASDGTTIQAAARASATAQPDRLPLLLELYSENNSPSMRMAPVMNELKSEYAETLETQSIDAKKNSDLIDKYRIKLLPTQIFFDSSGKELNRHEGYISKEELLFQWRNLGYDFTKK